MAQPLDELRALDRLDDLLRPSHPLTNPIGPTPLLDYLYIGGLEAAEDVDRLRHLGITHVLNCAAEPRWLQRGGGGGGGQLGRGRPMASNPYPPESGVYAYEEFCALDTDGYDVLQHYPRAESFVNRAKYSGGRVLVHGAAGVNRSGAVCVAYVMMDRKVSLFEAVRRVRSRRDVLLTNLGFRRQLVLFARRRGLI